MCGASVAIITGLPPPQPMCRRLWDSRPASGDSSEAQAGAMTSLRAALVAAALAHHALTRLLLPGVPQDPLHVSTHDDACAFT